LKKNCKNCQDLRWHPARPQTPVMLLSPTAIQTYQNLHKISSHKNVNLNR